MTWKLSAQIFVPLGDTFTLGSSLLGGVDGLGIPNLSIGDWLDLTCDAGSIDIKQGFAENDPLSEYEVGTCDLFLKGLTYAPTLNEDILPGVGIRVLISKDAVTSQFSAQHDSEFLTVSTPETQRVLFNGVIQDAIEDRLAGTVTIKAVDIWAQVIKFSDPTLDLTGVFFKEYLDYMFWDTDLYDWIDWDYSFYYYPFTIHSGAEYITSDTTTESFYNYGQLNGTGPVTILTPVQKGGPFNIDWDWSATYSTVSVYRLRASTPEDCVPGTASVDTGYSAAQTATTDYWRLQIDLSPKTAEPFRFYGVAPYVWVSWAPEQNFDVLQTVSQSMIGTFWVRSNGLMTYGSNAIWMNRPSTMKISDVHEGEHLCYSNFEQRTSLSTLLNQIVWTNTNDLGVESTSTFVNEPSVILYGRRSRDVKTVCDTDVWDWSGDAILDQTAFPESNVGSVDVVLYDYSLNWLPELLDFVDFEYDGTTQKRMVSRRDLHFEPNNYEGTIEFFDYLPYE